MVALAFAPELWTFPCRIYSMGADADSKTWPGRSLSVLHRCTGYQLECFLTWCLGELSLIRVSEKQPREHFWKCFEWHLRSVVDPPPRWGLLHRRSRARSLARGFDHLRRSPNTCEYFRATSTSWLIVRTWPISFELSNSDRFWGRPRVYSSHLTIGEFGLDRLLQSFPGLCSGPGTQPLSYTSVCEELLSYFNLTSAC